MRVRPAFLIAAAANLLCKLSSKSGGSHNPEECEACQ
jgi:hypothetical protein